MTHRVTQTATLVTTYDEGTPLQSLLMQRTTATIDIAGNAKANDEAIRAELIRKGSVTPEENRMVFLLCDICWDPDCPCSYRVPAKSLR